MSLIYIIESETLATAFKTFVSAISNFFLPLNLYQYIIILSLLVMIVFLDFKFLLLLL